MLRYRGLGSTRSTERFLKRIVDGDIYEDLEPLAQLGVSALSAATPVDTGETAQSWSYEIVRTRSGPVIRWNNSHVNDGANIAILIQYGHGTATGGYVQGRDYINPAIRPIFDQIANEVWEKVRRA